MAPSKSSWSNSITPRSAGGGLPGPGRSARGGGVWRSDVFDLPGLRRRGLVTSGAGRDLEQVRDLEFPVFTGSTICSHGYCHMLHMGLPVRIGGLMVNTATLAARRRQRSDQSHRDGGRDRRCRRRVHRGRRI
jgi:hypothetical protein